MRRVSIPAFADHGFVVAVTSFAKHHGKDPWDKSVLVVHYPHWFMDGAGIHPPLVQLLKEYARKFTTTYQRVILLCPEMATLPRELENDIPFLDFALPGRDELRTVYDNVIESIKENGGEGMTALAKNEIETLVAGGAGMTEIEFETALSTAVISHRPSWPNVTFEDINKLLLESKTEVIRRSEVLELMTSVPMSDIGGLESFKEWILQRKDCFTPEAREFGVDRPKGICLIGPPQCISGDTNLLYQRGKRNSSRLITMEALYHKFNGRKYGKSWDRSFPTYLHSFDSQNGRVFYNRIRAVFKVGIKEVYRLTTLGGRQIKVTANHPFLTEQGIKPARHLRIGQSLLIRGSMKANPGLAPRGRKRRKVVEGLIHYASGWLHRVVDHQVEAVYDYKRQHRARLVIEAKMNGLGYHEYVHKLKNDPEAIHLNVLGSEYDVHHRDGNPMNDAFTNLEVMRGTDHDRLHSDEGNFNVEYTAIDKVSSITPCGREITFDVQMEAPANNFATADGLLIHSTSGVAQKS